MKKYLPLFLFLLWLGTTSTPMQSNVILDGDVIMGNVLPDWGTVCIATDARGGPDEFYPVRYSVSVGETVRLHDLSLPDNAWVSIGVAQWIPLDSLCWGE